MSDFDNLYIDLDNISLDIQTALETGLRQAGKKVQGDIKMLMAVDTGYTRETIFERLENINGELVETIGSNNPNAIYEEFGTGPVGEASPKILPEGINITYSKGKTYNRVSKTGKAYTVKLKGWYYYNKKLGKVLYTEGKRARPSIYPAFKQNKENIMNIIKRNLQGALDDD